MFVRQLHYLVALAREAHFGRAAEACCVSQPTLSVGIRKLEEELGLPLVVRGHRFLGLTPQGERVLQWAQRIVADYEGLKQEIADAGPGLAGMLRIGVIPAALPTLPPLVNTFCARYPRVRVQIQSMPSVAIQRGLDELELDAGVTYLENEPLSRVRARPLYEESYVFVTREPWFAGRDRVSWEEAAARPLCLLTRDMQNRRIIDHILAEVGIVSAPHIEVNSFEGVWSLVCSGGWGGIVPSGHARAFGGMDGLQTLALVSPVRTQPIGLVTSDRDPGSPVADALLRHMGRISPPIPSLPAARPYTASMDRSVLTIGR